MLLAGVLGALALATVGHTLVTSIRRRRRDLAVLKTMGFQRRQVSAAVAWQATTFAAVAALIGLPAGIAVGRLAWLALADQLGIVPDVATPFVGVLLVGPRDGADRQPDRPGARVVGRPGAAGRRAPNRIADRGDGRVASLLTAAAAPRGAT